MYAAWDGLDAALSRVAPRTAESVQRPASAAVIGHAVASTGVEWPDELKEFYRVQNGQSPDAAVAGEIVPFQGVLGVEAVARWHAELSGPSAAAGAPALSAAGRDAAGSWFLGSYLPIAASPDSVTIYDTGAPAGVDRIRRCHFDGSDAGFVGWESITDMLETLARCILSLELLSSDLAPYVTQGVLRWGPVDTNYFRARDEAFQRMFLAPEFASAGKHVVEPVAVEPTVDGVDLMAVQRRLLELAAERYGASHITQVGVSSFHLPRVPGSQIGCFVAIDGVFKGYRARALDDAGNFTVEPDS